MAPNSLIMHPNLRLPRTTPGPWVAVEDPTKADDTRVECPCITDTPSDATDKVLDGWTAGEEQRQLRTVECLFAAGKQALQEGEDTGVLPIQRPANQHEVRGKHGFELLHPVPVFHKGGHLQTLQTHVEDADGAERDSIVSHDQLAKLVLYFVKDGAQDALRGCDYEAVRARIRQLEHGPCYSEGGSLEEYRPYLALEERWHRRELWEDLADLMFYDDDDVEPVSLRPPTWTVQKILHPDLLDHYCRKKILFTKNKTVAKYTDWVTATLASKGVRVWNHRRDEMEDSAEDMDDMEIDGSWGGGGRRGYKESKHAPRGRF